MDALGEFLTGLPMPLGPIVTGLLPFVAIGGFVLAIWASRRHRRVVVIVGLAIGLASLMATVAFLMATAGRRRGRCREPRSTAS